MSKESTSSVLLPCWAGTLLIIRYNWRFQPTIQQCLSKVEIASPGRSDPLISRHLYLLERLQ